MKLISTISHQRSGSHLFGTLLDSHKDIHFLGEFTHAVLTDDINLIDFKYSYLRKNPDLIHFVENNSYKIIQIHRRDIKRVYYSTIHAEVRRNEKTGEYADEIIDLQGKINAEKVKEHPRIPINQERISILDKRNNYLFSKYNVLADMVVYYEDLTNNEEIKEMPEQIATKVLNLIGVDYQKLTTPLRKQSPKNPKFKS